MVEVRVHCGQSSCGGVAIAHAGDIETQCGRCGTKQRLRGDDWATGSALARCPACDAREFFVRKDFPQRLGLTIVVVAAIASCVFVARGAMIGAWSVLAGAVVVDAMLALLTGRVTVCYRCRAEFRGLPYNPAHIAFDLATSEKYGKGPP